MRKFYEIKKSCCYCGYDLIILGVSISAFAAIIQIEYDGFEYTFDDNAIMESNAAYARVITSGPK